MSKEDIKNESNQGYELGFHLVPTLIDEEASKAFEEIINLVEKIKGKIISKSGPSLLNLEYQMEKTIDSIKKKYKTAYFAWIIFKGGDIVDLSEKIKDNKNIIRHLLIQTDQEDSISTSEIASLLDNQEFSPKAEILLGEIAQETENEILEDTEEVKNQADEKLDQSEKDKVDEAIDELVK